MLEISSQTRDRIRTASIAAAAVGVILGGHIVYLKYWALPALRAENERTVAALKETHADEFRASAVDTHRQIEAMAALLKESMNGRLPEPIIDSKQKVALNNDETIDRVAQGIAAKLNAYGSIPMNDREFAAMQKTASEKIVSGLSQKIEPILSSIAKDQTVSRESLSWYVQQITSQINEFIALEVTRNHSLTNKLALTQSAARDSVALSQELAALYLSSLKDQGALTRIISLPANILKDAASLSLISSSERAAKESSLMAKLADIRRRLDAQADPG
jgi:hypothetical protein